jgi:hypothetical protein
MRKTIYLAIVERLKAAKLGILHFGLWNNDIERLTSLKAFRTPAVLVEFEPVEWRQRSMGARDANVRIRLHVMSKTLATPEDGGKYQAQALAHIDRAEGVNAAIQGLNGDNFNGFALVGIIPDHAHETVIHEELIYTTNVVDTSAAKQYRSVSPGPAPVITASMQKPRQP